jgi:CRP/FNR family transcriptional regulator
MSLDAAEILANCRFFRGVAGPNVERLLQMAVVRTYARAKTIFREGDPCPGVFIVGNGLVRVYKIAPNGKEHVLHLVGPGGTFAEVAAIGGFPCPAFAEALEDTRCLLLPAAPFTRALRESHDLCLQLMTSMAGWVKHLVGLLEDIALRDAAGRLARYLLTLAQRPAGTIQLPSLKKHLASHLNLTSETLSRTLRRMLDTGLIGEDERSGLRILSEQGLRDLAEGVGPLL